MGYYVIEGTAISSITIPKNVSSSGYSGSYNGALANCKSLTEVVFESGMTKIPDYICAIGAYTSYITKVVIPESVKEIGDYDFYKCDNMTIYGYKNSYAESYAITENIPFVSVAIAKNASADDVLKKMQKIHYIPRTAYTVTESRSWCAWMTAPCSFYGLMTMGISQTSTRYPGGR